MCNFVPPLCLYVFISTFHTVCSEWQPVSSCPEAANCLQCFVQRHPLERCRYEIDSEGDGRCVTDSSAKKSNVVTSAWSQANCPHLVSNKHSLLGIESKIISDDVIQRTDTIIQYNSYILGLCVLVSVLNLAILVIYFSNFRNRKYLRSQQQTSEQLALQA